MKFLSPDINKENIMLIDILYHGANKRNDYTDALDIIYKDIDTGKKHLKTIEEPEIDIYLMALAKNMDYQIHTHLLCVPKKVSDSFIRQRQKQTGRRVKPSSYNYFFKALNRCLKALIHSGLFDTNDKLILWSHYTNYPIKQTHLKNPISTTILQKHQGRNLKIKKPKKLLKTRIKWMKLFLELSNV